MPKRMSITDLLLDPVRRTVEPRQGQLGFVRMFGEPESKDDTARTMRFKCSTANLDRYSEIVEPAAFAKWLPTFMQNPVFCAGHVYVAPNGDPTTIGRWLDLAITDDGLEGVAEFMSDDQLAERYWNRYSRGFQKAVSVGFITHAWAMREQQLDGEQQRVRAFTEVELVEISAVAIPANRESLVRAASAFAPSIDQLAAPASEGGGDGDPSIEQLKAALNVAGPYLKPLFDHYLHAGPGGHLCALIQDAVSAAHDHAGLDVDGYDDIPDDEEEPDPSPASEGETLNHELRQLVAAARAGGGDEAQQ